MVTASKVKSNQIVTKPLMHKTKKSDKSKKTILDFFSTVLCLISGMVRNPETQNPDRPKSRNPKSRQGQNPDRVKIPTGQNPDKSKSRKYFFIAQVIFTA